MLTLREEVQRITSKDEAGLVRYLRCLQTGVRNSELSGTESSSPLQQLSSMLLSRVFLSEESDDDATFEIIDQPLPQILVLGGTDSSEITDSLAYALEGTSVRHVPGIQELEETLALQVESVPNYCPFVVVVGHHFAHRDLPKTAAIFDRIEIEHMYTALDSNFAVAGPIVVPSKTACLYCMQMRERATYFGAQITTEALRSMELVITSNEPHDLSLRTAWRGLVSSACIQRIQEQSSSLVAQQMIMI